MTDFRTPNKRKRSSENSGFVTKMLDIPTSTPITKTYDNPSFKYSSSNKENNFFSESCMEVKSIADLVAEKNALAAKTNEYEVIRKPPKKKKKSEIEESCFVNPGLDLNAAEKPINPFEVVRDDRTVTKLEGADHCFTNPCLNINVPERSVQPLNPFEIQRDKKPENESVGIENPALDLQGCALMLPITPNINHRIDFNKIPTSMLNNKLVIDEENIVPTTPKRNATIVQKKSLSTISEELDIGEELDCYQLQLENSINEAKSKNQTYKFDVTRTFKTVVEEEEFEDIDKVATPVPAPPPKEINNETYTKDKSDVKDLPEVIEVLEPKNTISATATATNSNEINLVINDRSHNLDLNINIKLNQDTDDKTADTTDGNENPDVQYEEVDDDDIDFQKPAPFQRAYRKNFTKPDNDGFKVPTQTATKHKFGDTIRRSIRKLMHHDKSEKTDNEGADMSEKEGFLSTIRHSLRRKPKTIPLSADDLEMSIVVEQTRQVFKENKVEIKAAQSTEAKSTFVRNGLRRSTREMKKQVMKSVFQKKVEEFNLY